MRASDIDKAFQNQAKDLLADTKRRLDDQGLTLSELCRAQNLAQIKVGSLVTTPAEEANDRGVFFPNRFAVVRDQNLWGENADNKARNKENNDIVAIRKAAAEALILQECTKGAKPVNAAPDGAPLPNRAVQKPNTTEKH